MEQVPVIQTRNLDKSYYLGKERIPVLRSISFIVGQGEYVSIMGQSGAGKSTLLNILACLDTPTSGDYFFNGENISSLSENRLAEIRNRSIGFVFQNFNLLPKLTIAANVELPLIYNSTPRPERQRRVREILERFGLWERRRHKPNEISGGQKQRVAIARALVKKPSVIFADEPTGNLDSHTAGEILVVFDDLSAEGNTIIMITHERDVARHASRVIHLVDGEILP
ncbi:MAG: ABC transporter ATP-binding protein [Chitinispirillaceae bacterium]|nr:ABC transporter ATP-binding protein [Chitinispirillaceae bacterium]